MLVLSQWVDDGSLSHSIHGTLRRLAHNTLLPPRANLLLPRQGMLEFQTENRGEKLWVPSGTVAQEHKEYVEQYYGNNARISTFLVSLSAGGDVLQPAAFDAALALHTKVVAVEAEDPENAAQRVTWDNYCIKRGQECTQWNVLSLFGYNSAAWATREAILDHLNQLPTVREEADAAEGTCDVSGGFEITQLLGGITYSLDGNITGASALSFGFVLQNRLVLQDDNTLADFKVRKNPLARRPPIHHPPSDTCTLLSATGCAGASMGGGVSGYHGGGGRRVVAVQHILFRHALLRGRVRR